MWKKINPSELENPYTLFNQKWPLLLAGKENDANTMTISWGGLVYLWNAPQVMCVVRPQRHTMKYINQEEYFSLCILGEEKKDLLTYLGRVSGKDEDKIKKSSLTINNFDQGIGFAESKLVIVLKKTYVGQIDPKGFSDPNLAKITYPIDDFHYTVIGEIVAIYQKED